MAVYYHKCIYNSLFASQIQIKPLNKMVYDSSFISLFNVLGEFYLKEPWLTRSTLSRRRGGD